VSVNFTKMGSNLKTKIQYYQGFSILAQILIWRVCIWLYKEGRGYAKKWSNAFNLRKYLVFKMSVNFIEWKKFSKKMKKFSINWRKIIYTKGLGLERSKMGKSFPIIKLGGQR